MKRIDDYKQQIEHWKGVIQDIRLEADEERVLAQREKELRRAAEADNDVLRPKVKRLEAALAEWRKHDSAPDCVACAALDAATCDLK